MEDISLEDISTIPMEDPFMEDPSIATEGSHYVSRASYMLSAPFERPSSPARRLGQPFHSLDRGGLEAHLSSSARDYSRAQEKIGRCMSVASTEYKRGRGTERRLPMIAWARPNRGGDFSVRLPIVGFGSSSGTRSHPQGPVLGSFLRGAGESCLLAPSRV